MRATALVNGIKIIDLLEKQEPRRFGELRKLIGVAEPTLSAILKNLEEAELICKNENGYGIGKRGLKLSRCFLERNDIHPKARPLMQQLREDNDARIELGIPDKDALMVVDVVAGPNDVTLHSQPGVMMYHLIGTAPAKMCLAFISEEKRQQYYASKDFYFPTPHTLQDIDKIEKQLTEIRKTGYAEDIEEARAGIIRLSAIVRNHLGDFAAVLTIVLNVEEASDKRINSCRKQLQNAARELSLKLGYGGV